MSLNRSSSTKRLIINPVAVRVVRHASAKKGIRNSIIAIISLILIAVIAGIAYTYYLGLQPAQFKTLDQITPQKPKQSAPIAQDPNVPTSVSVTSFTTPVTPGSNAAISIQTNPMADCAITVMYNNVQSQDSGLSPKTADQYGTINWSWTVEESVPLGKWPITITCTHNKKNGMVIATLEVAKSTDDSSD